jgi:hypothetical protein
MFVATMSLLRLKFFNSMLAFISNLITYLLLHTSSNSMIFKNENKHISRFLFKLMDFEIMFSNIILKIQTLCSSNASSQEDSKLPKFVLQGAKKAFAIIF